MVAKYHSVGDGAADEELSKFEDRGLGIRRCFAIDFVTRKDY